MEEVGFQELQEYGARDSAEGASYGKREGGWRHRRPTEENGQVLSGQRAKQHQVSADKIGHPFPSGRAGAGTAGTWSPWTECVCVYRAWSQVMVTGVWRC